jgi:delta8-fatty-acid desaturase
LFLIEPSGPLRISSPRPCIYQLIAMSSTKKDVIISRKEIEGYIAAGKSIIIVDQKVLKVDPWLKYHPGGDKAILHMVGRDATDEVNA